MVLSLEEVRVARCVDGRLRLVGDFEPSEKFQKRFETFRRKMVLRELQRFFGKWAEVRVCRGMGGYPTCERSSCVRGADRVWQVSVPSIVF